MLLPRSAGGDQIEPWIYLHAIEEISRHDGSVGWNLFVANSAALDRAVHSARGRASDLRRSARLDRLGSAQPVHRATAVPGGYRVSGQWHFASGSPAGHLDGRALPGDRAGRLAAPEPLRPADHADAAVSEGQRDADPRLEHARHARHRIGGLSARRPLRAGGILRGTREDPCLRRDPGPLYAFTMQGLYAVGVAGVAFGIARAMLDAFIALAKEKTPRGLHRLADMPGRAVRCRAARGGARFGARLAHGNPEGCWATADDIAPDRRAAARPGAAGLRPGDQIRRSRSADYVYKAAGVSAIFMARRSSGGSATCTRCRSKSSRATRISKRSARSCSTAIRTALSCDGRYRRLP